MPAVAQEESPKLQPPLGEIPPTFWEQHGLAIILAAGGVVLLIVLGIWFWLQPKPVEPVPPEVQARTALEALSQRAEDGVVISQVSQILRQYVLAVFELPAGQPTTAEFCKLTAKSDTVGNELSNALAAFLRECDERKFAKSGSGDALNATARALELVNQAEARRERLRQSALEASKPTATT
ncbi:MAG TPA: hypothetical protein VFZ59_24615 [Verrucomicrobiae bacterium]|nr:hypothetical protein [Verrucomicrobiae bacterium]